MTGFPDTTDTAQIQAAPRPRLDGLVIAMLGLGLMGRPMAGHLAKAGATLRVWNRSTQAATAVAAETGATVASSPADAAAGADIVVICVTDTAAVEVVLFGPDGVAQARPAPALAIDMGTTDPLATPAIGQRLTDACGAALVDAPVSGGTRGAEAASLSIMAGGSDAAMARALPVLQVLGARITRIGGPGAGQVAKAANQVVVGVVIQAVAEALALAEAAGADPAQVRTAMIGGFADGTILRQHGERMVTGNMVPGGKSRIHLKDMTQATRLAEAHGLDLPATRLVRDCFAALVEQGRGELDHSALHLLLTDAIRASDDDVAAR
ncbi:NAD(P)-dependent oxidoreductase [Tistrella sp. BH-R2-4]|uniref:NAD(P)-dependent oxidoreductase n=1 Tax=Tistrella arctica TaxID=3133430 RepID=A0ABU9YK17_9PROT